MPARSHLPDVPSTAHPVESERFSKLLARAYKRLPIAQRRVADLLARQYRRLAFLSAEEVAALAGVSDSTVVRLAMALGYWGYADLQRAVREALDEDLHPVDRIRRDLHGVRAEGELFDRLMAIDEASIRETRSRLAVASVVRAAQTLAQARVVYIIGLRGSYPLAFFLALHLGQVRPHVILLEARGGTALDPLASAQGRGVLVAIAMSRYSSLTIRAAEFARQRGLHVLAITDSPGSPLAPLAHQLLLVSADDVPAACVAGLSLCNVLASLARRRLGAEGRRTSLTLETMLHRAGLLERG
ncbi:MAG: MurR/RpiR family transcriptional regulator [Armatimonadota bacterium]|nr:MurR/RpiR family transcriptional regulator [Armatimonadota bacterium]